MLRANFWIETLPGFVLLEDRGTGMSLTNDAANVVAHLAACGVLTGPRRILYRDTDGTWDEMLHAAGRFTGFAPVGARTREDALVKVGVALRARNGGEGNRER